MENKITTTKTSTSTVVYAALAVSTVVAAVAVGISVFSGGGLFGVVSIPGATYTCAESNETANNVDPATIPYYSSFVTYNGGLDNVKYFDITRKSAATCQKNSYPYSKAMYEDTCLIDVAAVVSGKTTWKSTKVNDCSKADEDGITKRNCRLQEGFVKNASSTSPAVSNWTYRCPNGCNSGACMPVIDNLYGKVIKSASFPDQLYYVGYDANNKIYARYVFPRALPFYPDYNTFDSWYFNQDDVLTVTDEELIKYPIRGNVMYRPGTKLLKISTDPKIFAVEPGGVLRNMGTADSSGYLVGIYGLNWNDRVVIAPDSFFSNYVVGPDWTAADKHPEGTLIQYSGSGDIYLIQNGQKRKFIGTGFADNRYKDEYIVKDVEPLIFVYPNGPDISAGEKELINVAGSLLPNLKIQELRLQN